MRAVGDTIHWYRAPSVRTHAIVAGLNRMEDTNHVRARSGHATAPAILTMTMMWPDIYGFTVAYVDVISSCSVRLLCFSVTLVVVFYPSHARNEGSLQQVHMDIRSILRDNMKHYNFLIFSQTLSIIAMLYS